MCVVSGLDTSRVARGIFPPARVFAKAFFKFFFFCVACRAPSNGSRCASHSPVACGRVHRRTGRTSDRTSEGHGRGRGRGAGFVLTTELTGKRRRRSRARARVAKRADPTIGRLKLNRTRAQVSTSPARGACLRPVRGLVTRRHVATSGNNYELIGGKLSAGDTWEVILV